MLILWSLSPRPEDICQNFANGTLKITTRQTWQVHGVLKRDARGLRAKLPHLPLAQLSPEELGGRFVFCQVKNTMRAMNKVALAVLFGGLDSNLYRFLNWARLAWTLSLHAETCAEMCCAHPVLMFVFWQQGQCAARCGG